MKRKHTNKNIYSKENKSFSFYLCIKQQLTIKLICQQYIFPTTHHHNPNLYQRLWSLAAGAMQIQIFIWSTQRQDNSGSAGVAGGRKHGEPGDEVVGREGRVQDDQGRDQEGDLHLNSCIYKFNI